VQKLQLGKTIKDALTLSACAFFIARHPLQITEEPYYLLKVFAEIKERNQTPIYAILTHWDYPKNQTETEKTKIETFINFSNVTQSQFIPKENIYLISGKKEHLALGMAKFIERQGRKPEIKSQIFDLDPQAEEESRLAEDYAHFLFRVGGEEQYGTLTIEDIKKTTQKLSATSQVPELVGSLLELASKKGISILIKKSQRKLQTDIQDFLNGFHSTTKQENQETIRQIQADIKKLDNWDQELESGRKAVLEEFFAKIHSDSMKLQKQVESFFPLNKPSDPESLLDLFDKKLKDLDLGKDLKDIFVTDKKLDLGEKAFQDLRKKIPEAISEAISEYFSPRLKDLTSKVFTESQGKKKSIEERLKKLVDSYVEHPDVMVSSAEPEPEPEPGNLKEENSPKVLLFHAVRRTRRRKSEIMMFLGLKKDENMVEMRTKHIWDGMVEISKELIVEYSRKLKEKTEAVVKSEFSKISTLSTQLKRAKENAEKVSEFLKKKEEDPNHPSLPKVHTAAQLLERYLALA